MENPKKIGLFTLSMIVIGSMIGSGILLLPRQILPFGLAGTFGWILSGICSFILARIFVNIMLATPSSSGIAQFIAQESGLQASFLAGLSHVAYMIIASSLILFAFIEYLSDFFGISDPIYQFIIAIITVIGLSITHYMTSAGFQILSTITVMKILLFGLCAILGITEFNLGNILSHSSHESIDSISIISVITKTIQASSVAIFAFAGIENAAASSDIVDRPHSTVPNATMIGMAVCSFIYLFTHICVVNALGSKVDSAPPVKTALVSLITGKFGEDAGMWIGIFVSIIAILGCLGTLLAVLFVAPNVMLDTIRMADSSIKPHRSKTGLPAYMSLICAAIIVALTAAKYIFNVDLTYLQSTTSFLLLYFYFSCVIAHFKAVKKTLISLLGFGACMILLVGCDATSVFIGTIIQLLGQILFVILSKRASVRIKNS